MSWNIQKPGDYINGPLTVMGVATFNSQVTVNSTLQVTGNVAGQGALIGRDGGSGGATYGANAGNVSVSAPAGGQVRFNVNNGVFAGLFDTSGNMGILNSSPFSGNASGLTIGTLGSGSAKQITLQMANCYARIRERNVVNDFAITTNINVDSVLDDNTRPSWMMRLGAGSDLFSVFRAAAASTSFTTLATVNPSGDFNLIGNIVPTSGKGIDFSATPDQPGRTSELLQDYEEGTWTGTLTFSTTPQTSTNAFTGRYTKVGRLVSVQGQLLIGPTGFVKGPASGNLTLTGLPYAVQTLSTQYQDLAASIADISSGSFCFCTVNAGGTSFSFESMGVVGAVVQRNSAAITAANFAATNAGFISLAFNFTYTA